MNKEPATKTMEPSEFIPPPFTSELKNTPHSSDTQIETQPKKPPFLKLDDDDDCQSNDRNLRSSLLMGSKTCVSSPQDASPTMEETLPSAEEVEVITKELSSEGLPVPRPPEEEEEEEEDSGCERLKRHRTEVAGRVWIPEIWGQEDMLKDLIDCSAFDASLVPSGIISARAALAQEGGRSNTNSGGLRIENSC